MIDLRRGKIKLLMFIVLFCAIIYIVFSILIRAFFYPIKYETLVNKYSKQYELDSHLVFSIIRTESKFNPKAQSPKNAKGLMQITDKTGEWAAREIGIEGYSSEKLYDPEINIQMGCWYIKRLLIQYNNVDTALAAYNAGSGNVSKWLKNEEYSKDGENLIIIPFKETREYVKKVSKARIQYKRLYK
ncbi:MAG: lytic transglycosylase domain-containing protein [Epulopiscium sp.]|nr:lytic transglycosylase domain-containing protein [Candidatus Epulonipiscium sp.]